MLFNSNAFYIFFAYCICDLLADAPETQVGRPAGIQLLLLYERQREIHFVAFLLTTAVSYGTALVIEKTEEQKKKKLCMGLACWSASVFCSFSNTLI